MSAAGWTALLAIATWLLVIGTLISVYFQLKQQREINSAQLKQQWKTNSANMVMIMYKRFDSSNLKSQRKHLSSTLLLEKPQLDPEGEWVLVFFETLGLFTDQKILDEYMVWNEFSWWVIRYYLALTNIIAEFRKRLDYEMLYCEFERLAKKMIEIDRQKRGGKEIVPTPDEIKLFLEGEKALITGQERN